MFVSIRTVIYQDLKKNVIELLVLVVLVSTREDPKITNEMGNKNSAYSFCCLLGLFFYFYFCAFFVFIQLQWGENFQKRLYRNGKTKPTYSMLSIPVLGIFQFNSTTTKQIRIKKINNNWLKILNVCFFSGSCYFFFFVLFFISILLNSKRILNEIDLETNKIYLLDKLPNNIRL